MDGSGSDGGERWIGVKMMERAEEVLSGIWLGMNVDLEGEQPKETSGGCCMS